MHQRTAALVVALLYGLALLVLPGQAAPLPQQTQSAYLPFVTHPLRIQLGSSAFTTSPVSHITSIVGEIINNDAVIIYDTVVIAQIATTAGPLQLESAVLLRRIDPQQRAPFEIPLPAGTVITSYTLALRWQLASIVNYRPLFVSDLGAHMENNTFILRVFVQNLQTGPTGSVRMAVTMYDASGLVADVVGGDVSGITVLNTNDSTLVIVTLPYTPIYSGYLLQGEGVFAGLPQPTVTPTLPMTTPTNALPILTPTFSTFPTATAVTTRSPSCAAEYPTVCIPPPPPDLNCPDISFRNFKVLPPDRHGFDTDHDGIGCEQN